MPAASEEARRFAAAFPALPGGVASRCRAVRAETGEFLWREGDDDGGAAFVLAGRLELLKNTEFGGRRFVVALIGPGSVAGESSLLDDGPRAFTAAAAEPCELLLLGRAEFRALLAEDPAAAASLLTFLLDLSSRRLVQAYARMSAIF